jgi:isocitrate dehydrogenase
VTSDISLWPGASCRPSRSGSPPEQQVPDNLAALGALTLRPEANIIKLPNISASVPQLKAAIKELQDKGYADSGLSRAPATDEEKAVRPATPRCWLGGEPRPARRQLRPPRPACR